MGWWRKGDMLVGDGPVDLFEEGMKDFVREHGKPTWPAFVDALGSALGPADRVKAIFKPDGTEVFGDASRAQPDLRQELSEIVENIREEYRDYLERDPSPAEIVATADFSLGVRPEDLLSSDGPMPELDRLVLEPSK
jgi:hypothetical protein